MKVSAEEKTLLDPAQPLSNGNADKKVSDPGSVEMTTTIRQANMSMNRLRPSKQNDTKIKKRIQVFVEGNFVTVVMSLVTLFALVGDDIRLWATNKNSDNFFFSGLVVSFILFGTEILLNTVVIDGFKYSFFFWLDIVATLSLIIDIAWIMDVISYVLVRSTPSDLKVNAIPGTFVEVSQAQGRLQQVVKSLRLIRLIRIIKLYKYVVASGSKDQNEDKNSKKKKKKKPEVKVEKKEEEPEESEFKKETDPSKLGKELVDSISRRTIVGVLLMLMILPFFTRSESDYSGEYALREVFWFGRSSCQDPEGFFCKQENEIGEESPWITQEGWYETLRGLTRSAQQVQGMDLILRKELLWLYAPDFDKNGAIDTIKFIPNKKGIEGNFWEQSDDCSGFAINENCEWRVEEMDLVRFTPVQCIEDPNLNCDKLVSYARFKVKLEAQEQAKLQFFTTIFTCGVLTIASLTFSSDIESIVIIPIKKIVDIIQRLAEGPLKKPEQPKPDSSSDQSMQMKTKMLELTIFKIGTLLQRGFGEKGAQIVSRTLTYDERFMELQIPGRKVNIIFSICQIRQFSETTECLQDEIIVFVNKIVKIVHECAKRWDGVPTNNNGDTYILSWKLPNKADVQKKQFALQDSSKNEGTQENELAMPIQEFKTVRPDAPWMRDEIDEFEDLMESDVESMRTQIADKALISAVKTVAELSRAQDLQAYSRHPKIQPKFGDNYTTQISFGIHMGFAVEGSIGTDLKVDALYLSPDMQIALRVEELNEIYGTQILMTGEFMDLLSIKGQETIRQIDQVLIKQSQSVHRAIWCYDMKPIGPLIEDDVDEDEINGLTDEKIPREIGVFILHEDFNPFSDNNMENAEEIKDMHKDLSDLEKVFVQDHDFVCIQKYKNEEFDFRNYYLEGLQHYITGEWSAALSRFQAASDKLPNDGPTKYMIGLIEKSKVVAPEDWANAFDMDKKPVPPEIEYGDDGSELSDGESGN